MTTQFRNSLIETRMSVRYFPDNLEQEGMLWPCHKTANISITISIARQVTSLKVPLNRLNHTDTLTGERIVRIVQHEKYPVEYCYENYKRLRFFLRGQYIDYIKYEWFWSPVFFVVIRLHEHLLINMEGLLCPKFYHCYRARPILCRWSIMRVY